jgi:hypothetical protein
MTLTQRMLPLVALLLSAGCSSLPRGEPVAAGLSEQVVERYGNTLPSRFEAMHTVIVAIKPHWWWPTIRQATIGCSTVDRTTRSYEVTCLSPLGMKLFNVSCTNGTISGAILLPMKDKQEPMVQAIGSAISRAYLDMTPGPGATAVRRGDDFVMSRSTGNLRTDYTFSGTNAFLTSKEYFDGRKKTMTITYGDYQATTNASFPGRMSLRDHGNGYSLLFFLEEFRDKAEIPSP